METAQVTNLSPQPRVSPPVKVMRTPRALDLEITARCNLRCRYCYFFDNSSINYRDLPTSDWLTFFEELGHCGVMTVTLQGGEPFIRRDLPDLIQGIVRNRMRFSILSNGTLIHEDHASLISGTGRCDAVQVSVDGSTPETHDSCRGNGSFHGAIKGIQNLKKHKVPVDVRMTLHRHNIHDIVNTARLLLEVLELDGFSTNAAGYLGTCRLHAGEVMLNTRERQMAMEALLHLQTQYKGRVTAMAGPLAEAHHWREMEIARIGKAPPFPHGGFLTGCGCANHKMAVRADGVYLPCSMLPDTPLGRINQDDLERVWQESPLLNNLRNRHTVPLADFEFCRGCSYIPYCTGNCPGLAYSLTGKVDHPSPDACLKRFLDLGGTVPDGH